MNDSIEIYEATIDDLDTLAALNAEVQNIHVEAMPWRFKVADLEEVKACFRQWMNDESVSFVLARVGKEVAGYTVLKIRQSPEYPFCYAQSALEVDHIGVAEKYRGEGVGKILIDDAKTRAKELGIDRLQLSVWDFNRNARDFFCAQGFRPASHTMHLTV